MPGSAWQSRGQGFESPYLHSKIAGQALAGASGPGPGIPIPARIWVDFLSDVAAARRSTGSHDSRWDVLPPFTGLRSHRVHGAGRRSEIARVEVGVGAEIDGRIATDDTAAVETGTPVEP